MGSPTANRASRAWVLLGLAAGLVMLLAGYFLFISPKRSEADDIRSQVKAANDQAAVLQHRLDELAEQNTSLKSYQQKYQAAQLALPGTSGLPDFLRTLQSLGDATRANVTSLTVGTPALANPQSSGSSGGTTAPSAGRTAAGVYALPVTAQVNGSVPQLADFLDQLQNVQPRAVLISQINETSSATNGKSETTGLTVTLQVFVEPASAAEQQQLADEAKKD